MISSHTVLYRLGKLVFFLLFLLFFKKNYGYVITFIKFLLWPGDFKTFHDFIFSSDESQLDSQHQCIN